jgi:hypothetical protein
MGTQSPKVQNLALNHLTEKLFHRKNFTERRLIEHHLPEYLLTECHLTKSLFDRITVQPNAV